MLKLVLFLQVVILIVFGTFAIVVFQQAQTAADNLNEALVVIGEVSAILPKLDVALDSINQLEAVFDDLESLSSVLSLLTDPFNSGNS
jgi:predicted Kef-type K+ transport protein